MTQPPLPPQQHVPYYEGPPVATFDPQPAPPSRRSRGPFVVAGVALVAAVAAGAALLATSPWHSDTTDVTAASTVRQTSPSAPVPVQGPKRPHVLNHAIVEDDLNDNGGQVAPDCNGGEDIPAVTGRQFVCVTDTAVYVMRVGRIEVGKDGSTVGWDVVVQHPRHAEPTGAVLHHDTVEKFLVDLEDATAPVCNGAEDIAAKTGASFSCFEGSSTWKIRISAVDADGGVHYELLD